MRGLTGRLLSDGFVRNVAVIAGGTAFAQGVSVLVTPFLTRIYSPDDFGVLAVYASILSVLTVVAALRYEYALPLPKSDGLAASTLVVCTSAVAEVCLLVWGDRIVGLTNTARLRPFLWLLPVGVLLGGVYQSLSYWAIRMHAFGRIAKTKVSQGLSGTGAQLLLGLFGLRPAGLIIGQIIGQSAGMGTFATLLLRHDRRALGSITLSGVIAAANRYRRFPLVGTWSAFLSSLGPQLPNLLFASFYGTGAVGNLALAQKLVGIPIGLVGQAVSQVYFGEAARILREAPAELERFVLRVAGKLVLVAMAIVPITLVAPRLVPLLFGSSWREAGVYLQLMTPALFVRFVVAPVDSVTVIAERQDLQFYADGTRAVLNAAAIAVPGALHWEPTTAIALYSLVTFVTYGLFFAIALHVARKVGLRASDGPTTVGTSATDK